MSCDGQEQDRSQQADRRAPRLPHAGRQPSRLRDALSAAVDGTSQWITKFTDTAMRIGTGTPSTFAGW